MRCNLFLAMYITQALDNIKCHVLRSFLTLLGVLVGTAAVVALLSGSELATQTALAQFKKLGTDLLSLSLLDTSSNGMNAEDSTNLKQLQDISSSYITSKAPYTLHYSSVGERERLDVSVLGVTQDLKKIMKFSLEKGRFISYLDNTEPYCVLGSELAAKFSGNTSDLIGKQIRVDQYYFTVIGILQPADKNLFLFSDTNQSILIPIKTSLLLYKDAKVKNIIFKITTEKVLKQAEDQIVQQLQALLPGVKSHFSSPENIIKNMEQQNHVFTLLLGFIGCISLIVGGIGVMNIMLVSVSERRREIGIRMAVGATKKDILFLFLVEAAVLATLGGILGILVGESLAFFAAKFSHWDFHLILSPLFIGFFVSVFVGVFFGFYPARKAAQLDPIEILRT